jgi:hypothetical protein
LADETTEKEDASPAAGEKNAPPEAEKEAPAGEKEAPAGKEAKAEEPSPRAVRFANITLGVAVFLCATQLVFAVQTHRPTLLRVLPVVLGLLIAASFKLKPARRVTAAMILLPAMILVYGFEWNITRKRPYDASMAARKGNTYDTRSMWEVIREERAQGIDAQPSFQPRALLVLDLDKGLHPDELQNFVISKTWGVEIDGQRVLPLGGIANKHIVYCNEGGTWAEYDSDEHGFNNPKGIWEKDTFDAAYVGDSFTQAQCVPREETTAHLLRQRFPASVNLAMSGSGPLIELAGIEELLSVKKPKTVFWFYYNNDMGDLSVEKQAPTLMKYLEEDGFKQNLAARQDQIDAALLELSKKIEAMAPRWPSWLEAIGLNRKAAPIWLGDLAMNENHSSATAVMRLDRLSWAMTSLAVKDVFAIEPDFPLFKRVLARAKSRVESWGGKLVFVYVADMFYLQYKGKREHHNRAKVLETAREVGLPVIDTMPAFMAVDDPLKVLAHLESHCNGAGYKLMAETIFKALDEGLK